MERQKLEKLVKLCPANPTFDLCAASQPELWIKWCETRGRQNEPSNVWTEIDVYNHIWSLCYDYPDLANQFGAIS